MHAWAYDENGYPSGFGSGKVNSRGESYQQKFLRMQAADADRSAIEPHRIIKITDRHCFYYEVDPSYVDVLDPITTAAFIDEIYRPYYEKFGNSFEGFFTDEPQISRNGIPWSLIIADEYRAMWGEDLLDSLHCLFLNEDNFSDVRIKFWKLVTELFSKNYMKQIYDWCVERGYEFTGHLVLEETLEWQLTPNGACMPHYEYLTVPGMDWLGRDIFPCLIHHQVASVAAQTGKKQVLSESYALCGHGTGHDVMKRNYEWMTVRGINLLCQHLAGYSLRGIRKRDYPPAMHYQQPWWDEYHVFNDAMSRVGMILAEGKITFDTLLMHNMTSAWACFNNGDNVRDGRGIDYYNKSLIDATLALEAKHIPFHLGDEIIMERHARVEGNKLIIGEMEYTTVVLPEYITFLPNTERLLDEFRKNGGIITTVDALTPSDIIDNENITYTYREFDGFTAHYFVNSHDSTQPAKISRGSYAIDIITGERVDFCGKHIFAPYESIIVIDDGTPCAPEREEKTLLPLDTSGKWSIVGSTHNSLTLDRCDYWFDGKLVGENAYVMDVGLEAYELERPVDLKCRFKANIANVPETLYLVCETPEIFKIEVNGIEIDKRECGYFRDKAFRMIDVQKYARVGENVIDMSLRFAPDPKIYGQIKLAEQHASEMNKFKYEIEIESVYLVGDFAVECDGEFENIEHDAVFFDGKFTVAAPRKCAEIKNLERQGYTFFAGSITFSRKYNLDRTDYKIVLDKKGVNAIKIKVNGKDVRTVLWAPYEVDLSDYLTVGENTVEITVVNSLRNLLGPHHLQYGEDLLVRPLSFYRKTCLWNFGSPEPFTDKYCFVETGIF
jgi:hypothetical protein